MASNAKYWGYLGVSCLQMSAIPGVIQALATGESAPVSSIVLVILGLMACTVQEINAKLWAYVAGSVIGIIGHAAILFVLIWR